MWLLTPSIEILTHRIRVQTDQKSTEWGHSEGDQKEERNAVENHERNESFGQEEGQGPQSPVHEKEKEEGEAVMEWL